LVAEAVVVAIGDENNKRLVADVVPRHDEEPEKNMDEGQSKYRWYEQWFTNTGIQVQLFTILTWIVSTPYHLAHLAVTLRSHLTKRLPEYMVPSAFVRMDAFPLNANGKLDRRALPDPGDDAFARETYEEPQGEIEQALASIWSDLLNVDHVSRHDSFFALGGHSLLAVRMMNRINALGVNLPLAILFNSPSLSAFAQEWGRNLEKGSASLPAIDRTSRDDLLPLSFAQQRLWFLSQLDGVSDTYHIPLSVRLRGPLDQSALQGAFDGLFDRHEALRSVFVNVDGQPHVRILPAEGMTLTTH
jgi:hypothetical protein